VDPIAGNDEAVGFDLFSEPARREAVTRTPAHRPPGLHGAGPAGAGHRRAEQRAGHRPRIHISAEPRGGHWEVTVADDARASSSRCRRRTTRRPGRESANCW
jgi:hypothetical protein